MERNNNYDLKLAGYIWSILRTRPIVMMSWGIDTNTVRPVNLGLEFHVQGFRHTGMVQVILDEGKDLFEIHLIPDSEGERKIIEDVYFDMLVSVCLPEDKLHIGCSLILIFNSFNSGSADQTFVQSMEPVTLLHKKNPVSF